MTLYMPRRKWMGTQRQCSGLVPPLLPSAVCVRYPPPVRFFLQWCSSSSIREHGPTVYRFCSASFLQQLLSSGTAFCSFHCCQTLDKICSLVFHLLHCGNLKFHCELCRPILKSCNLSGRKLLLPAVRSKISALWGQHWVWQVCKPSSISRPIQLATHVLFSVSTPQITVGDGQVMSACCMWEAY